MKPCTYLGGRRIRCGPIRSPPSSCQADRSDQRIMITIFPVLSISTRAMCTPAAVTALTALVTSCCRNVEGARAILSHPLSDAVAPHLHLQPHSDAMQDDAADAIST